MQPGICYLFVMDAHQSVLINNTKSAAVVSLLRMKSSSTLQPLRILCRVSPQKRRKKLSHKVEAQAPLLQAPLLQQDRQAPLLLLHVSLDSRLFLLSCSLLSLFKPRPPSLLSFFFFIFPHINLPVSCLQAYYFSKDNQNYRYFLS